MRYREDVLRNLERIENLLKKLEYAMKTGDRQTELEARDNIQTLLDDARSMVQRESAGYGMN